MTDLDPLLVDALGADLRSAGYTTDGVAELLGADANAAMGRGVWWPALRSTRTAENARLATLIRLFLLGTDEPVDQVQAAFPSTRVAELVAAGVLEVTDTARAALDIRPHSDGERDFFVVSDQDAALRGGPVDHEHVLGIGGASMSLARAVIRTPVQRALDLGTGCGIQALHLNGHCADIVATDTNPRALKLAQATAGINGMSWDLRPGSLFDPVAGERFDLIVSNPPFVVGKGAQDYIYRDSGVAGDGLCRTIIEKVGNYLTPGGTAQIMANWIVRGDDWQPRVQDWLAGTGLHAWVVQRELADPVSYVSLWLADAGESAEQIAQRGADWLDWFDAEGITGIGMGLISLRVPRPGEEPEQILEEITDEPITGPRWRRSSPAGPTCGTPRTMSCWPRACRRHRCCWSSIRCPDRTAGRRSAARSVAPAARVRSSGWTRCSPPCSPGAAARCPWARSSDCWPRTTASTPTPLPRRRCRRSGKRSAGESCTRPAEFSGNP